MQQVNVIHAIKHIFLHELTKTSILYHLIFFLLLKRASIFFSHQSPLSLFIMDPLCSRLLCSLSANPVTFESCIFTSASSICKFFYDSINTWIHTINGPTSMIPCSDVKPFVVGNHNSL